MSLNEPVLERLRASWRAAQVAGPASPSMNSPKLQSGAKVLQELETGLTQHHAQYWKTRNSWASQPRSSGSLSVPVSMRCECADTAWFR